LLFIGSLLCMFFVLELGVRIWVPAEVQTNNEYRYREPEGRRVFGTPFHSWYQTFPKSLDVRGYYARNGYRVEFHFNQVGARWLEPQAQTIQGYTYLVLGDSFTYGSGLWYRDSYVFETQVRLNRDKPATLLNFGHSGADTRRCLAIYNNVSEHVPHDAVIYALHLNDLISFDTSFVLRNQLLNLPVSDHSRLMQFVLNRVNTLIGRPLKIAYLTSPQAFEREHFHANMPALLELKNTVEARGKTFLVVMLPILIDIREGSFEPIYQGFRERFAEAGIRSIDLTHTVRGQRDDDLWILPVDQHPNEIASGLFARSLAEQLLDLQASSATH
jgi:hypothetical protein